MSEWHLISEFKYENDDVEYLFWCGDGLYLGYCWGEIDHDKDGRYFVEKGELRRLLPPSHFMTAPAPPPISPA